MHARPWPPVTRPGYDRIRRPRAATRSADAVRGGDRQAQGRAQADFLAGDAEPAENSAEHSWHLPWRRWRCCRARAARHRPGHGDRHGAHPRPGRDRRRRSVPLRRRGAQARQDAAERAAADRIFAILPPIRPRHCGSCGTSSPRGRPAEARFARALDRLQPMLREPDRWRRHLATARDHRRPGAGQGRADRGWLARRSGTLARAWSVEAVAAGLLAQPADAGALTGSREEDQLDRGDDADHHDDDAQRERRQAAAELGADQAAGRRSRPRSAAPPAS